jgi:hypothetical protein
MFTPCFLYCVGTEQISMDIPDQNTDQLLRGLIVCKRYLSPFFRPN